MRNKVLIIIGGLLICLCIGIVIPNAQGGKAEGLHVDKEQLKKNASKEFQEEMIRLYGEDQRNKLKDILQKRMDDMEAKLVGVPAAEAQKIRDQANADAKEIMDNADQKFAEAKAAGVGGVTAFSEDADDVKAAVPVATTTSTPIKNGSLQSKIDANRDKISDADLASGQGLYGQIDAGYLSGLMEGGLTPEEDAQMQEYLHSNFSGAEYENAKALYYRYVHLLNE